MWSRLICHQSCALFAQLLFQPELNYWLIFQACFCENNSPGRRGNEFCKYIYKGVLERNEKFRIWEKLKCNLLYRLRVQKERDHYLNSAFCYWSVYVRCTGKHYRAVETNRVKSERACTHTQNECCDTLERVDRWKFNLEFLSKRAQKPLSAGVHYSNAAAPRLSYIFFFAFLPGPRHFSPPPPTIVIILNKERGGRRIAMEKLQPSTARLFQKEFSQQQLLLSAGEKNECRGGECSY